MTSSHSGAKETNFYLFTVGAIVYTLFGDGSILMRDWLVKLNYYHPILVTGLIFLSQSLLLLMPADDKKKKHGGTTEAPWHAFLIPSVLSFANHCCMNAAYIGLPGSILNMMKGLKQIEMVLLSMAILGKRLKNYEYLGFFTNMVGIVLLFYAALGPGVGWASGNNALIAAILAIAACTFGALQNVWEEKVMHQYAITPTSLTGMEGVYGTIFVVILSMFLNLFNEANFPAAMSTMWRSPLILCICLGFIPLIPPGKYGSRAVTCYGSAIMKSLLEVARVSLVWGVELICRWDHFSWIELFAFLIVTLGTMVYGKMVKVPCLSYEEVTEEQREPVLSSAAK